MPRRRAQPHNIHRTLKSRSETRPLPAQRDFINHLSLNPKNRMPWYSISFRTIRYCACRVHKRRKRQHLADAFTFLLQLTAICLILTSVNALIPGGTCNYATVLKFGQSASLTGSTAVIGQNMQAGISAAFREANARGGARGLTFELITLDDTYETAPAINNTQYFASRNDIFAIVGNVGTAMTTASVPIARAANLPFIGAYTGTMALRKPFQRDVINLRPSYVDEASAMVEYLVNVRKYSRIALMLQNDSYGESGRDGVLLALGSNNLYLHSEGRYTRNTVDISAALSAIASPRAPPEAIILFGVLGAIKTFILEAKKIWKNCLFLAPSVVGYSFAQTLLSEGGTDALQNVIVTQVVPVPTNISVPVVASYQRAMTTYFPSLAPDFASLEGYLVGRLVVDAVRRIPDNNITADAFLNAIYDTGSFNFDGLRCGPYLPADVKSGCNSCMRSVHFTNLLPDASFATEVQQASIDFDTCGYVPRQWTFVKFGHSAAAAYSSATGGVLGSGHSSVSSDNTTTDSTTSSTSTVGEASVVGLRLQQGILSAFKEINDKGGLLGVKLDLVVKEDRESRTIAEQNLAAFVNDSSIFGLIGSASATTASTTSALAGAAGMTYVTAGAGDPFLTAPFQSHIINFRASLRDEIAGIIRYFYQTQKLRRISVFYHTGIHGMLGRTIVEEILASYRLEIYTEGSFDGAFDAVPRGAMNSLALLPLEPQAIIMFGPYAELAQFVIEVKTSLFASAFFATVSQTDPDSFAERLLMEGSMFPAKAVENVIVTQVLPLVTSTTTDNTNLKLVSQFIAALQALSPTSRPSALAFEGYVIGRMLISTLGRISTGFKDREALQQAFYDLGILNMAGIRCGPFELPRNSTSSALSVNSTGCNQCMKTVWLSQISTNGNFSLVTDNPTFEFSTCGSKLTKTFDFKLMSWRLVPVTIACLLILSTAALMCVLIYHRDHYLIKGSWRFSVWTCFGGIICYCLVFVFYPIPTDNVCFFQPWLGHLSFVIIFGPLFAKTRRTAVIFNNKKLAKIAISDTQVMQFFGGLLALFVLYLIIWTSVDPPKVVEEINFEGERYERCASTLDFFPYGMIAIEGAILLWGSFLCYRVQGLGGDLARFNESKKIGIAIYSTSSMGLILFTAFTLIRSFPNGQYYVLSTFIIFNTIVVVNVLFLRTALVILGALAPLATESNNKTSTTKTGSAISPVSTDGQSDKVVSQQKTGSQNKGPEVSARSASMVNSSTPQPESHVRVVASTRWQAK